MKYKQVVKLIIDIAMYLIFVALMQEHLWDGLHEWLGIALFTLFIVHTILNFRWYQSLFPHLVVRPANACLVFP